MGINEKTNKEIKGFKNKAECPYCGKKISLTKAFCSDRCKVDYFEYIKIQISPKFVKRVLIFISDKNEQIKEIKKMSEYHGFDYDLCKRKFKEVALEKGYGSEIVPF